MTHLLLVSNNPLQTSIISMVLDAPGIEIHTIDRGQCVVEFCQKHSIKLIIFLSISPYFTSMNIVEKLRESLPSLPSIYVIAASHSATTLLTLMECGVNQYMSLPLNLLRLRSKVFGLLKMC